MSNSKLFQGLSLIMAAFSETVAADVAEKLRDTFNSLASSGAFSETVAADVAEMLRETFNSLASGGAITKPGTKAEAKTKDEKSKEEPVSKENPEITAESLRGKASELIDADRDALIKILKKNKVKRVSECPEEKLQTVYNDIVAALEEATCL